MSRADDVIDALLIVLCIILFFIAIIAYALIFGNSVYHRNGVCGSIYRFLTFTLPCKVLKLQSETENMRNSEIEFSFLNTGFKFLIIVFDMFLYSMFVGCHWYYIRPYLNLICTSRILPFVVLPWPWILTIAFQYLDPGEITKQNVDGYLEIYKYDNNLYVPKTVGDMPVVPRSRWCKYSNKMIA